LQEIWAGRFKGSFQRMHVESRALTGNALGDPTLRPLWVYLPPAYLVEDDRRFPVIYQLQGFLGEVDDWWNRKAFRPAVPELVDDLFSEGDTPAAIVAFVDAWTALGGSQFLNSPGTGRYMDYLCDDVTACVDRAFRTIAGRDHRALAGKSSGGYGAMVVSMSRPDVFGAFASHAGDALFEYAYLPDIAYASRILRDRYECSYEKFWADFRSRPAFSKDSDFKLLNTYAMAACYSAEADGTVSLPMDSNTGMLRGDVWSRWLELDPVRIAPRRADALISMRGIYLDAGTSDEYFLDLGAQAFSARLRSLGVEHVFQLFDARHGAIEYRYPKAWRYLSEALCSATQPSAHKPGDSPVSTGTSTPSEPGGQATGRARADTSDHHTSTRRLILETDGASRGNPGLAGAGIVIKDAKGAKVETIHKFLGVTTNNQAEYRALIEGLRAAARHKPDELVVRMDSELLVKQMNGEYRVKHPELLPLYLEAAEAAAQLPQVKFEQVPRGKNATADKLSNLAIDTRMVPGRGALES
jgi:ribonuclease HI/S-formylglutathione hydrolase FrmB